MKMRSCLALAFAVAVTLAGIYFFYFKEPSFEGRTLSEWVWFLDRKPVTPETQFARNVVRHLGTNAIPLLLRWVKEPERPSMKEKIYDLKTKVVGWLTWQHIIKPNSMSLNFTDNQYFNHRTTAGKAFAEFDSENKKIVIRELIVMLQKTNHPPDEINPLAGNAYVLLPLLAPESIDPLIGALTNYDNQVWFLTAGALANIGTNASSAIPAVTKRLQDNDPRVRVLVADNLRKLGDDPDTLVPIIIQSLPKITNEVDLGYYLGIAAEFKQHAQPAIPTLLTMLNSFPKSNNPTNEMYRGEILTAIRDIDPETELYLETP